MRRARPPIALLAGAVLLSSPAHAEDPARRINILNFKPTPGEGLTTDDARPLGHLVLRASTWFDLSAEPLYASGSNRDEYLAVERMVTGHLTFAFGLWDRVELGALFPVVLHAAGDAGVGSLAPLSGVSPGDLRISPKIRIYGEKNGFNLSLSPSFSIPTGTDDANAGEKGATFEPELAAAYHFREGSSLKLNVGYRLRPQVAFGRLLVDDEVTFSAGFSAHITGVFGLSGEVFGALGVNENTDDPNQSLDAAERPVEALGSLDFDFGDHMLVVGGGAGLTHGYGAPLYRAFLGWNGTFDLKPPPDQDLDGVDDADDRCDTEPEDRDGFRDDDGCPDPDNDNDGLADTSDQCPLDAEDRDDFEDADGCPDPDNDKDGVADSTDKCPVDAEDQDSFEDADGCPDLDNDNDSFSDNLDKCPLEPETKNGVTDDDGCPDEAAVQINEGKIEFKEPILFALNLANIDQRSSQLLDDIAALIAANPQLTKIRIEGHTDLLGNPAFNLKLSEDRAKAVLDALVARGIAADRFTSQGFGPSRPLCKERTPACDAKNRRTELILVEVNGKPVTP
jgi:outer membrane protein OmpA-like peptidoglycan-associated protein